jgi:hypothetical protein
VSKENRTFGCYNQDIMVKAVLRNGGVQLLQPVPDDWTEGQELIIEPLDNSPGADEVGEWLTEMDVGTSGISAAEQTQFLSTLDALERESKELSRREWDRT